MFDGCYQGQVGVVVYIVVGIDFQFWWDDVQVVEFDLFFEYQCGVFVDIGWVVGQFVVVVVDLVFLLMIFQVIYEYFMIVDECFRLLVC